MARKNRSFPDRGTERQQAVRSTTWEGHTYYWPQHIDPEQYSVYRASISESERRSAEELPPEEVANAVHETLFLHGSLSVDELVKETARLLGYARAGAALDKVLRNGIRIAVQRGTATENEGRVSYGVR